MADTALPRPAPVTWPALAGWARRAAWQAPLVIALAVQAALTARLIPVSAASGDEGRYIYAGHQLIHELWHGGGSPYYETYFSGSPVIYPVLAAMADHLGGLAAVRLMSLCFMLAATGLLFATGRRLFGYWAGVAAAALFAGLGLTQDLGALATHDALALMLTAAAAYCAARTGDGEPRAARWLIAVPLAVFAANATKYATLIFDPVIIGIAAAQVTGDGWRRAALRVTALAAATVPLLALMVFLAGNAYFNGLMFSTLNRQSGTNAVFATTTEPGRVILAQSWAWIGAAAALAAAAVLAAAFSRRDRRLVPLLCLLLAAGLLVTAESLRLHTAESMRKHDDLGAWFTCMAAGYLLARLTAIRPGRAARATGAVLLAGAVVVTGTHYSATAAATYEAKTSHRRLEAFATLKPWLALPGGRFLIGGLGNEQMAYTDHLAVPWWDLGDDIYIKYPVPGHGGDARGQAPGAACTVLRAGCVYLEGVAGFQAAIRAHWFALVSMIGGHKIRQDAQITGAVEQTPGYVLLTRAGGAPTWIYAPAYRSAPRGARQAPRRSGPSPMVIAGAFMVTMIPSALFAAAGLLFTGLAVWQRRRRASPSYAPLYAWAWFLLVMATAVTLGLAEMAISAMAKRLHGRHAAHPQVLRRFLPASNPQQGGNYPQ